MRSAFVCAAAVCIPHFAICTSAAAGDSGGALSREVEVILLDGRTVRGELRSAAPQIELATDGQPARFSWEDVLVLRPTEPPGESVASTQPSGSTQPAPPDSAAGGPKLRFVLSDGSAFGGTVASASGAEFSVRLDSGAACRLEPGMISNVRGTGISQESDRRFQEVMQEEKPDSDVAVVARGDKVVVLRGAVKRITPREALFTWDKGDVPLPWDRVAGIRFARPTPRSAACTVFLTGGDAFAGRIRSGDDHRLTLQSGVFDNLELPWSRVLKIESRSDRLTLLSELRPATYESEPFFDKRWDYVVDRTLTGEPIRLGGQEFPRGVAMHSRSALTYAVDRAFTRFAATVGIADEMEKRGNAAVAVVGDGRVLWQAKNLRGGEPPQQVVVDVRGVTELKLVVDYGQELDLSDHVVWAFPRLIR